MLGVEVKRRILNSSSFRVLALDMNISWKWKQFRNMLECRRTKTDSEIIKNNFAYDKSLVGLEVALIPSALHKMLNYLFFPKTFPVFIKPV